MKKLQSSLLAVFTAIAVSGSAHAAVIIENIGSTAYRNPAEYSAGLGYQFVVGASDLSVTALGIFDARALTDQQGLLAAADVSLFRVDGVPTSSTGTLLATTSFAAGTDGEVSTGYAYNTLATPVTLTAGARYVLQTTGANFFTDFTPSTALNSAVTREFARIGGTGSSASLLATTALTPDGYNTANAQFTVVPEPSTAVALFIASVGFGLLTLRHRSRLSKQPV